MKTSPRSPSLPETPSKAFHAAAAAAALATQTPEKPPENFTNRGLRNSRAAISLNEIRKAAAAAAQSSVRKNDPVSGPHHRSINRGVRSARKQILATDDDADDDEAPAKLPVRYEMLGEFFDSLDSSIRLLRLNRSASTFTSISPMIERLTDRRFSHRNLAQLKYILPEAIEIKRVLMFDERTSCMKPYLYVTVNPDAVECDGKELNSKTKNMHLREVFRARLGDFYKDHPEADEVPEEMLPEPFNQTKQYLGLDTTKVPTASSPIETSTDAPTEQVLDYSLSIASEALEVQQPAVASHFSTSFRKRFSHKVTGCAEGNGDRKTTILSAASPIKVPPEPTNGQKCPEFCNPLNGVSMPCLPATPSKEISPLNIKDEVASFQSTPAKLAGTPGKLMSSTPVLRPPKRCHMSPDEDSTPLEDKLVRRSSRTRSLQFDTPVNNVDNAVYEIEDASVNDDDDGDDVLNVLPESLLQSIREKERETKEEQDPAISQAKRRRQMIACLPKLFNSIHYLFQSIRRSVITREELVHKIIAGNSDIVDRREVEEQLNLLLELVPEWITEKQASCGDLLCRINKMSTAETIQARLEEAK